MCVHGVNECEFVCLVVYKCSVHQGVYPGVYFVVYESVVCVFGCLAVYMDVFNQVVCVAPGPWCSEPSLKQGGRLYSAHEVISNLSSCLPVSVMYGAHTRTRSPEDILID